MLLAMNATVTTMSSKPWRCSSRTMCSIIGRLARWIIGFGWLEVSGRRRVPSPPAMITAFIAYSHARRYPSAGECSPGQRDVLEGRLVGEDQRRDDGHPGE